jgi:hypothetical protein
MSWTKRTTHCVAAVAMSCLAIFGGRAEACMVCIPFPQNTVADDLLSATVIVLARENPKKPFSYVAVEVLKGDLDAPQIELFLDSTTRQHLAFNPDRSVVLALGGTKLPGSSSLWNPRSTGADASPSTWRSLGYASSRYEAIVREILARAPRWRERVGWENRAKYFMPYLADAERSIRELAYLEVGRASYDTIREADRFVSADQLRAFLAEPQYLEWRALYILLLGIDAKPDEEEAIREAMAGLARFDQTLNLSAWATALIEIDGEKAIDWLEAAYLGAPDRDPDAVLEIVKAVSVHGAREQSRLRGRIAESYGALIEAHPSLAGWAARDLTAWHDWRFAEALDELRKSRLTMDGATAYAIDYYIGRARSGVSD